MSTNYYARYNTCDCCKRYDELHIGKFAGKSWSFEGHFQDWNAPWLTTAEQWRQFLRSSEATIVNEYGREESVEEFIASIDEVSRSDRRRQYDWLDARRREYGEYMDRVEPAHDWLDPEGYSFHGGEFS